MPRAFGVVTRFAGVVALLLVGCGSPVTIAPDASVAIADASDDAGLESGLGFGDDDTGDVGVCTIPGQFGCPPRPPCNTVITGVVTDPAGKTPLENVVVYIPNNALPSDSLTLPPLGTGTSACQTCDAIIHNYVAATITDATGAFTLPQSPEGRNVPLVIQTGKWRRQIVLPNIVQCQTTVVPGDLTHLPRNQSEGDIPQMAVLTGGCDQVACFLSRVGIDASEFTGPAGGGRVHVYRGVGPGPDLQGGGAGPAGDCTDDGGACPLWNTKSALERYDVALLGCECGENNQTKPDMGPMHDWLGEGGRLFAIHNQETWLKNGPADFQDVASWSASDAGAPGPYALDTTTPKGLDYQKWLMGVGALGSSGALALNPADVSATISAVNPATTRRWIYDAPASDASDAAGVTLMTVGVPVASSDGGGAPNQCGRAIVTDVHIGANGQLSDGGVPASCTGDLSPEEKALEFLLFDYNVCASSTQAPPVQTGR